MERSEVVDSVATGADLLPGRAAGTLQLFGRLLSPPAPRVSPVPDKGDDRSQLGRVDSQRGALSSARSEKGTEGSQAVIAGAHS